MEYKIIIKMNKDQSPEEIEIYSELLNEIRMNGLFILPNTSEIEFFPINCLECNIRNWLRQKKYYFGWK